MSGVENCTVLAVFATRSREDSEIDPLEDELDFIKAMRVGGFKKQLNFQMPLSNPVEECLGSTQNMLLHMFLSCIRSTNQQQWDYWMKGRLMMWGDNTDNNHFVQASELARTGKLPEAALTSEICAITGNAQETERHDAMRICAATRSAQKGAGVWQTVYRALLTTSKALPAGSQPLLRPIDEVIIMDIHVHSGDHALGSAMMLSEGGPALRHIMARFKDKKSFQATEWSQKRTGAYLCSKWLKHEIKLYTSSGAAAAPITADVTVLSEEDKAHLKTVPGAWEAYQGTTAWQSKLRACSLAGTQVTLLQTVKADFAHAPPSIKQKFEAVEKAHNEQYGSILKGKITLSNSGGGGSGTNEDPRPNPGQTGEDAPPETLVLPGPETEAVLRQQFKIIADVKTFDHRGVALLVADSGHCFIVSKEDTILRKGTKLGGLGGGRTTQEKGDRSLKMELPDGDRTLIEAKRKIGYCLTLFVLQVFV